MTAHDTDAPADEPRSRSLVPTAPSLEAVEAVLLSRSGVVLACAVLILLLCLNALVFLRTTQTLLAQDQGVVHRQQVLAALAASQNTLTAAESAQRGYILYGDPAFLRSYAAAARAVTPGLAQLRRLVSDNADQARRVEALVPLAEAKLAGLEQAIALRRTGQSAQAQDIVVRNGDQRVSAAIQRLYDTLTRAALALLRQRDAQARAAAATTTLTLIVATAVDAALLASVLLTIQRLFVRRARLADERGRLADERGRLLREAQQARAAAEAAVKMRNDFLLVAAHDLRTPLTNVLGRGRLIEARLRAGRAVDPPWLSVQLDALLTSTNRLIATVNELNDMVALEQGEALDLALKPVELTGLARGVADEIAPRLGAQGLAAVPIVVDGPAEPVVVAADPDRLARVLQNVIGNAVKYSVAGTPVHVEVRQAAGKAVVAVRDQGVGIPADELSRIFERFYRASTARGITGSGIGLVGAKASVEQHGGAIAVASAVGEGTTVTISLPVAPTVTDAITDVDEVAPSPRPR